MLKLKPIARIDMHSHYFPDTYYQLLQKYNITHPDNVFIPNWSLEKHLSDMDAANIIYSCFSITSPFFSFVDSAECPAAVRSCNEEGAKISSLYPELIGILAALPLPCVEASIDEIHYCINQLHVKGFALPSNANGVYMGSPLLDPVMEVLNQYNALVTLHPTAPSAIPAGVNENLPIPLFEYFVDTSRAILNMVNRDIFKRFPNIRFVMPHAGGCFSTMVGRLSSGAGAKLDIEGNMRRMYFDLAGSPVPVQLRTLLDIVGAERLLYGVDFPYPSLEDALSHGSKLDSTPLLTEEERQLVYTENAKKLLSI
jgi:predicted TIM-barrel fold metal-dependent hydrolase